MSLRIYRDRLPHWRMDEVTYFVTWCLKLEQPILSATERSIVQSTLRHADGVQFDLLAYVVMQDHVHALVAPRPGVPLEKIIHSWRSFTTNQFQRRTGRSGQVWQHDYFDRIMRSEDELRLTLDYIISNPWRRWPELDGYEWLGVRGCETT